MDVHFVILDGRTGRPLNASQALDLLDRTNALQRLQEEGYAVTEFRAAVPVSDAPAGGCTPLCSYQFVHVIIGLLAPQP